MGEARRRGARQERVAKAIASRAEREGWNLLGELGENFPPRNGTPFEVLHFGTREKEAWIVQNAIWDHWGILPIPKEDGDHCKRSTITHWRPRKKRPISPVMRMLPGLFSLMDTSHILPRRKP